MLTCCGYTWNTNNALTAYMYNDYIPHYPPAQDITNQRFYGLFTGSDRHYWGDTSTHISVPYTFVRAETPWKSTRQGPLYVIFADSPPPPPVYGYQTDPEGRGYFLCGSPFPWQPAERMLTYWAYPTTRHTFTLKGNPKQVTLRMAAREIGPFGETAVIDLEYK